MLREPAANDTDNLRNLCGVFIAYVAYERPTSYNVISIPYYLYFAMKR